MGKFINKVKNIAEKVDDASNRSYQKNNNRPKNYNSKIKQRVSESISTDLYDGIDDIEEDRQNYEEDQENFKEDNNFYDDGVGIQPAQKPESFHHFILENQYKDLEKSIRGYKDVYDKKTREWLIKRKDQHCFTDEEAEDILRHTQSLLATDIKLGFINKEVFGEVMMMLFKQLNQLFREIAEYKYGRYSHDDKGNPKEGGYAIEQYMKLQNKKIFIELTERIKANYSRSIQGMENKLTHQSVSAQESLQNSGRFGENRGNQY